MKSHWWAISVTRLNNFWNFLVADFITKVAQMFSGFLGSCENHRFLTRTGEAILLATFGKTWATFNCNIWSHCGQLTSSPFRWRKSCDRSRVCRRRPRVLRPTETCPTSSASSDRSPFRQRREVLRSVWASNYWLKIIFWRYVKNVKFLASFSLFSSLIYSWLIVPKMLHKNADDWIWTPGPWWWKWPLYHMSHNHCHFVVFSIWMVELRIFWYRKCIFWRCLNSWEVSHSALIRVTLRHALGSEFKPQWWQTLFSAQA